MATCRTFPAQRRVIAKAAVYAIVFASSAAWGQAQPAGQQPGTGTGGGGSGAAGVRLEPFVLYPAVTVLEGYNDNVTLTNNNRVTSAVTVLSPALLAELKGSTTAYRLSYLGNYGWYSNSSTDNYQYHEFRGGADFDFSVRSALRLNAEYLIKSDPRGSTLASTNVGSPNEWNQAGIAGVYSYGAAGAQGRIEAEGGYYQKRYTNNRLITETLDYDLARYGGTFFWRVGPKTEWLIQGQHLETDYNSSLSVQDNKENRFLTGLKWEATALTTGTAKVGYSQKKYTSSGAALNNVKGGIWEVGVRWSPLTYSVVDFATGKNFNDSQGGLGSTYVTNKYYNLIWTHAWTERIRSVASGSYLTDDFSGIARNDKTSVFGLKMTYDMRRWLIFGAEYQYTERDSSLLGADYKKNVFLLSVRATL
jgi:hypothetical protein